MRNVPILGETPTATSEIPSGALYFANGQRLDFLERDVAKTVEEYDAGLILGRRLDSGEWVIFMRKGPNDGEPFPVLGLGFTLPSPEHVRKRMYETDVRRHGDKIRLAVEAHNERVRLAAKAKAEEQTEVMAEHLDFAFRQQGVHPFPQVRMGDKIGNKARRNK